MNITLDQLIQNANSTIEKQASAPATTHAIEGESVMYKEAQANGLAIAQSICDFLEKQAAENLVVEPMAEMKRQDDEKIEQTPVAGKTVTETAEALLRTGARDGNTVTPEMIVHESNGEGGASISEEPIDSNLHKQAAQLVNELVENGADFQDAVALVKEAQDSLMLDMEKAAAIDHLVDAGIDWNDAALLVKQACEGTGFEGGAMEKSAGLQELIGQGYTFDEAVDYLLS